MKTVTPDNENTIMMLTALYIISIMIATMVYPDRNDRPEPLKWVFFISGLGIGYLILKVFVFSSRFS